MKPNVDGKSRPPLLRLSQYDRAHLNRGAGLRWLCSERLIQFVRFCIVGGSGVVVDMGVLYLLADPNRLGLSITLSKIIAAETAMINNFLWNEIWTFQRPSLAPIGREGQGEGALLSSLGRERLAEGSVTGIIRRFLLFNAICGIGIGLAVLLLHFFHTWLGWNLFLSNLLTIILVSTWNFGLNARFNWRIKEFPFKHASQNVVCKR